MWYNFEKELIGLKFWDGKSIKNFCDVGALVLAGLGVEQKEGERCKRTGSYYHEISIHPSVNK